MNATGPASPSSHETLYIVSRNSVLAIYLTIIIFLYEYMTGRNTVSIEIVLELHHGN